MLLVNNLSQLSQICSSQQPRQCLELEKMELERKYPQIASFYKQMSEELQEYEIMLMNQLDENSKARFEFMLLVMRTVSLAQESISLMEERGECNK